MSQPPDIMLFCTGLSASLACYLLDLSLTHISPSFSVDHSNLPSETMKLFAALLALAGFASAAKPIALHDVPADSDFGAKLLSKARMLNNNNGQWDANGQYYNQANQNQQYNANNQNGGNQGGYMDMYGSYNNQWQQNNQQQFQNWYMSMHTWVKDYSIKFQGCHHVSEWNNEANDAADVRIATRRLIKFRLCPSYSCLDSSASGCEAGYGDYIIDIETFLEAYLEAKEAYQGWMESMAEEQGYQYYGNNWENEDVAMYTSCQQADVDYNADENNMYGGQGEYAYGNEDWNGQLYMGPYCASQGGAVYVGLFMDETCTQPIDATYGKSIYYNAKGESMPFSQTSLVEMSCFPCSEPNGQYANYNNQGDDAQDDNEVCEACETLYTYSGKCEENLPISGNVQNNKACNYLEGIKVIRQDGTVLTTNRKAGGSKRNGKYGGAFAFVGIFSVAFVVLSAYVYYLKEKLDRASIQLAE